MTWEIWLAYAAASMIVLALPGPTIMLVVTHALKSGRKSAYYTVPGVILGDISALVLSLAGLGALLAYSASLFTIVKLIGAGYLIYLGIQLWRSKPEAGPELGEEAPSKSNGWALGFNAFAVTTLNPKGIMFFIAFLPQFVVADAAIAPQLTILGATFVILAGVNAAIYAMLAGSFASMLRKPVFQTWINRIGGSFLIAAGASMAVAMRRTS